MVIAPFCNKFLWTMHIIRFTERFEGAENRLPRRSNRVRYGIDGFPFVEVFDVPFSFTGKVLQLPGKR
ncbi:hypothetical protein LB507_010680 [Fusarium sp. FIESC RH6]|nr:hypothetical protein LB507_010680 [Fusarium sp. FIESC RH6]